jgi:Zn-dependent protease
MKWSLKIGHVAGIGIYVHWTFLLLIGWILFAHLGQGHSLDVALKGVGFILALFTCVVLHELGHALTAKRYNIMTRDITLLPIGGVARLERLPEQPWREFVVAIAGPAVNVVIAAILFALIVTLKGLQEITSVAWLRGDFLVRLMWVNVFLVGFNLLPAFPMDGGRIQRAALAARMGRQRATEIAASVGQAMAILFGIFGFMFNPFLIFIAIFVFLGAQAEAQMVTASTAMKGLRVRDAMLTRYRTLEVEDPLSKAVEELLAGSQQDFPVMKGDRVAGVLRRNDLVKALSTNARGSVGDTMSRDCLSVDANELLDEALARLREQSCATAPVLQDGGLVGLLTLENIGELVMINSALGRAHSDEKFSRAPNVG